MRIIVTVPSLDKSFGGPFGKAGGLLAALTALGHSVALVGAGESAGDVGLGQIGRFHATPVPRHVRPLLRVVRDADIVHVLGLRDPVGTIAALEARRRGVPVVLEPVGMHRRRLRSLFLKRVHDETLGRIVIRAAARVVASSHLEADAMVEDGIARDRISIRPNGALFDDMLPLPQRGPLREELGIPASSPLVVTIARINAIKGLPVLVRGLSELPDAWGLIAGPDERDGTMETLVRLRKTLGLGTRLVILPEGLWGQRKMKALAEADCFCLPSLHESFGTAALEAAGVGVPVVTTEGCGVAEWLDRGASCVVAPGDSVALSRAIDNVLGSSSFRARAVEAATRIRSEFSWAHLAVLQVEIYRKAAQGA
jgi:glycosyltransferase involved in cell wall biosynthesis